MGYYLILVINGRTPEVDFSYCNLLICVCDLISFLRSALFDNTVGFSGDFTGIEDFAVL